MVAGISPEVNEKSVKFKEFGFFYTKPFYYGLGLLVITFISFFPSLKGDFMQTWDDEKYVTANPIIRELSAANLGKMFTKQVNGTYVPLPLLSFAIDYTLFGDSPMPYHATNLVLHLISTLLVFWLFRLLKLDIAYAAFGALLFGIHPMRIESVAWITERKDVLYSVFYLASLISYIRYVTDIQKKPMFLLISLLLFLAALCSKIEAVTLPLTLLLVDYLMKRPLKFKLLTEKIPYFIFSLLFGLIGIFIIYRIGLHNPDFLKTNQALNFSDRFFYGLYAITGYLIKFLFPYSQSAIYPYPVLSGWTLVWIKYLNPVVVLAIVVIVWRSARKTPVIVYGMLFFMVNIFFLLQVVAVGNGFFADRYTYIPYLGLIFITAWFAEKVVEKYTKGKVWVFVTISVISLSCCITTFSRCKVWNNGVTLWSNVISQYPGRIMESYVNRGIAYTLLQEWDSALADFTMAISIGPGSSEIFADRGIVYGSTNQPEKAIDDFSKAIGLSPHNIKALFNRGATYANTGQNDKAKQDFLNVLALDTSYVSAYAGLCTLMIEDKRFDTCRILAEKGIKLDAYRPELYAIRGNCELETGDTEKAIDTFRHCLRLDNNSLDAYLGLAASFVIKDDREEAFRNFQLAREVAHQKNIRLENLEDIEKTGITLPDLKKEKLSKLLSHK